jgi:hypothetical protein
MTQTHKILDGTYLIGDPRDRIPALDFRLYRPENGYVIEAGYEQGRLSVRDDNVAVWVTPTVDVYPSQIFRLIQKKDGQFTVQNVSSGFFVSFNGKDRFYLNKIA